MKIKILQVAIVVGLISTGNPTLQPVSDPVNTLLSPDNPKPDQGQTQQVNATQVCKISILGRCLDVTNSTNGTPLQLATCTQTQGQDFTYYSDGTVRVYDKCVQVSGLLFLTSVQLYDCNSKPEQNWTVISRGVWKNPSSNECMFVIYNKIEDGQTMTTSSCDSSTYKQQSFDYNCVAAPTVQDIQPGTCAIKVDDKCIGVEDATMASGTPFEINACDKSQRQSLIVLADGTIKVFGKCMEVKDDQTVQLNDCNGSTSQQWVPLSSGQLRNVKSNKCLDVQGGTVVDGTPLIINVCRMSDFSNQGFERTCVLIPPALSPPTDTQPTGICTITETARCVNVVGSKDASGTGLDIFTCNEGPAQAFDIQSDGTIKAGDKCVDVKDTSTNNLKLVQLNDCNGGTSQQWSFLTSGQLLNSNSSMCLDLEQDINTDGTPLVVRDCQTADISSQKFGSSCKPTNVPPPPSPPKIPQPTGTCAIKVNGKCVGVNSDVRGTQFEIDTCSGKIGQGLILSADKTIRVFGMCMDVKDGRTENSSPVQLNNCNGTLSQQWVYLSSGQLKNENSNRCLDVQGGKIVNGQPLIISDCHTTDINNQAFESTCVPDTPPRNPQPKGTCQVKVADKCITRSAEMLLLRNCRYSIHFLLNGDGTIRLEGNNYCMTVVFVENSALIHFATCRDSLDEQWVFLMNGQLKNVKSNQCLEVKDGFIPDNQPVIQDILFVIQGTPIVKQQIILNKCKSSGFSNDTFQTSCDPICQIKVAGKCIGLTDGNGKIGTAVVLNPCSLNKTDQLWTMDHDGTIRVLGKCIDSRYVRTNGGVPVLVEDCYNRKQSQLWSYDSTGQFRNPSPLDSCLDIADDKIVDGQPVVTNKCKKSNFGYQAFEQICNHP